jgi:hypothetical protein
MNPVLRKRLTLALQISLGSTFLLSMWFVALSKQYGGTPYDFLATLLAGLALLAACGLAILFALTPVENAAAELARRYSGVALAFLLLFAGLWVLVSALILLLSNAG